MAIVFTKDISEANLLMAYNNNIVEFSSNTAGKVALNCNVTGFGINALIYPLPNGTFYFNLLEWISVVINTKNFADDLVTDLVDGDASTFTYDVKDGCYKDGNITFKINFTDTTNENISRGLKFIAGVENLETYKKNQMIIADSNYLVLSPVADRSNNTTLLKYWEGYPFEFSFFTNFPTDDFTLKNLTNGLDYTFTAKSKVTAMYLSDGRTDVTIEDFLPLINGMNTLRIEYDGDLQDTIINIDKKDADCGIYLKWLNKYGRYNYWLFSDRHFRTMNSRYGTELANDFKNLEDTISPTLQSQKNSQESLKLIYERLTLAERVILDGIIESPKVFMFTGERYAKANSNDWLEVTVKSTSFPLYKPNTNIYKFELEIEPPQRYSQSL